MNFAVDGSGLRIAATAYDPASGRVMEISTNQAGVQFYTANGMKNQKGKGGAVYPQHGGFCLETQAFPDAINKEGKAGWPSIILRPGQTYRHVMVHRFSVKN